MVYLDEERSGHFNEQLLTLTFDTFQGITTSINLDDTQSQILLSFLKNLLEEEWMMEIKTCIKWEVQKITLGTV